MKTQRFFWYVSLKIVYLYHKSAVCYVLCDSKLGFSVSIVLQPVLWGWMSMCSGSLITLEMTITVTVFLSHRHVSWRLGPSLCSTASSSRRFRLAFAHSPARGVSGPLSVCSHLRFGLTSRSGVTGSEASGSCGRWRPWRVGRLCTPT